MRRPSKSIGQSLEAVAEGQTAEGQTAEGQTAEGQTAEGQTAGSQPLLPLWRGGRLPPQDDCDDAACLSTSK